MRTEIKDRNKNTHRAALKLSMRELISPDDMYKAAENVCREYKYDTFDLQAIVDSKQCCDSCGISVMPHAILVRL